MKFTIFREDILAICGGLFGGEWCNRFIPEPRSPNLAPLLAMNWG